MTILNKSMFLKKNDKSMLLVPEGVKTVSLDINNSDDAYPGKNVRVCGFSHTMCAFFIAITVLTFGFLGGLYLYDEYGRIPAQFHGWSQIKLKDNDLQGEKFIGYNPDVDVEEMRERQIVDEILNSFREYFEIGFEEDNYEKIDVPDFNDGRRGRFIHDFNTNKTGIMDPKGRRCFIMPLDRNAVLPPKSLMDLVNKMREGYYEVDMSIVKQNMRVVLPPIEDFSQVGVYIARECQNYPTYTLEKYVSGVFKRSIQGNPVKYTQYAGKSIQEFDIMNWDDVLRYEEENKL